MRSDAGSLVVVCVAMREKERMETGDPGLPPGACLSHGIIGEKATRELTHR